MDNPLEKYIIYLKVGIFKCDSNQMIASINEAMDLIHSDISYLMLVITDAAAYNLKANRKLKEIRKDLVGQLVFVICYIM